MTGADASVAKHFLEAANGDAEAALAAFYDDGGLQQAQFDEAVPQAQFHVVRHLILLGGIAASWNHRVHESLSMEKSGCGMFVQVRFAPSQHTRQHPLLLTAPA